MAKKLTEILYECHSRTSVLPGGLEDPARLGSVRLFNMYSTVLALFSLIRRYMWVIVDFKLRQEFGQSRAIGHDSTDKIKLCKYLCTPT